MWKYVSRRFKDTVERTYNVLDVRRTWTCGVTNDNCNDKKKNSSVPPKCDLPSTVIANTDFSEKYSQNDSENSSSSGDEKRTFNFNHGTNTSKFCPLDCIGALYWVSFTHQRYIYGIKYFMDLVTNFFFTSCY